MLLIKFSQEGNTYFDCVNTWFKAYKWVHSVFKDRWAGGFLKWKEFGDKISRPGLESFLSHSLPSFNCMNFDS